MFDDWWVTFIIGLIFTGVIVFFMNDPEVELSNDLSSIRTKLDVLTEKVEEIKKTIDE